MPAPAAHFGLAAGAHLAVPSDGDTLYRLVRKDKERLESFKSRAVSGRGKLPSGDAILHAGLSMFETVDQARARATRYSSWVLPVTLRPDMGIHLAKTLGHGHYSVWGDPRVLRDLAVWDDAQDA